MALVVDPNPFALVDVTLVRRDGVEETKKLDIFELQYDLEQVETKGVSAVDGNAAFMEVFKKYGFSDPGGFYGPIFAAGLMIALAEGQMGKFKATLSTLSAGGLGSPKPSASK